MKKISYVLSAVFLGSMVNVSAFADDLYRADQYRALTADQKAYRAGDNLTILVVENASATTSAGTSSERSTNFNLTAKSKNSNTPLDLSVGDDAQGKGKIERSGKLLAQITVVVTKLEPSGLLNVEGEQAISFNNETQQIKIQGKIRPSDISENNTVLSTRLSDAKISYIGKGILGDRQKPGLITRALNWLGL